MNRLISEKTVLDILKNGKKYSEHYYSMLQLIEIIKAIPPKNTETQGDDRWLLHFGQNKAIPSVDIEQAYMKGREDGVNDFLKNWKIVNR